MKGMAFAEWRGVMKKADREIYLALTDEINWGLCGFCRYAQTEGSVCCDGYFECVHPLEVIADQSHYEALGAFPGNDCWGFKPKLNVRDTADVVGIILAENFDPEKTQWVRYSPDKIVVEGSRKER